MAKALGGGEKERERFTRHGNEKGLREKESFRREGLEKRVGSGEAN